METTQQFVEVSESPGQASVLNAFLEEDDLARAREILNAACDKDQKESDSQTVRTPVDRENFRILVEVQKRMLIGMRDYIEPATKARKETGSKYRFADAAFEQIKLQAFERDGSGPRDGFCNWKEFRSLKEERDLGFLARAESARKVSLYWDQWKALRKEAQSVADKAEWALFFRSFQVMPGKEAFISMEKMDKFLSSGDEWFEKNTIDNNDYLNGPTQDAQEEEPGIKNILLF